MTAIFYLIGFTLIVLYVVAKVKHAKIMRFHRENVRIKSLEASEAKIRFQQFTDQQVLDKIESQKRQEAFDEMYKKKVQELKENERIASAAIPVHKTQFIKEDDNLFLMNEEEIIAFAKSLKKNELKNVFDQYKEMDFYFPAKAYAFIQKKLSGEVWLDDDDFRRKNPI